MKKQLQDITQFSDKSDLETFLFSKGNAKLGDALVNFLYSLAKSIVLKRTTGVKVPDAVLTEAYNGSLWRDTIKIRGKKDRIADAVEALVLYFWIQDSIEMETLITPLTKHLEAIRLHHPREEHQTAIQAFQMLLDDLFHIWQEQKME